MFGWVNSYSVYTSKEVSACIVNFTSEISKCHAYGKSFFIPTLFCLNGLIHG